MEKAETTLKLRRLISDPAKAPEAVHYFVWARSGTEFLLECGHVDFLEAHKAASAIQQGDDAEPLDLIIVRRFSLSPESLERLGKAVNEMLASAKGEDTLDVSSR